MINLLEGFEKWKENSVRKLELDLNANLTPGRSLVIIGFTHFDSSIVPDLSDTNDDHATNVPILTASSQAL